MERIPIVFSMIKEIHRIGSPRVNKACLSPLMALFTFLVALSHGTAHAQDISLTDLTNLGGDMTSSIPNQNAIQVNAPNVTDETRRNAQLEGFSVFHRIVTPSVGLGPLFNHRSCGSCHVNNGRGPIAIKRGVQSGTSIIVKISKRGLDEEGAPRAVGGAGLQLRDHGVGRRTRPGEIRLSWRSKRGKYPDGTPYKLRRPVVKVVIRNRIRRGLWTSMRMTPPVIGPGLLEAIPEETLINWSDPDDANSDGISGRLQWVPNRRTNLLEIGRFGFRGSHPTLEQQSAAAASFDIGLTNPIFFNDKEGQELGIEDFDLLNIYQRLAGVPRARDQEDPSVIAGKALFQAVGCHECHKFNIQTSSETDPEIDNQLIHPFTDLLLHDMGDDLADKRAEYSASGREWRTTPLWGLGFSSFISNVRPRYLHDGRARSIEEAILWHGGEGEIARESFKNLSQGEREQLLAFLESL